MSVQTTPGKSTYVGLFMVTLATLMYEILLTRIFSVTMWYHYAFVAISIAIFGMTIGGILVYLFGDYFTQERVKHHLALSSFLFAVSALLSFITHLCIPFVKQVSFISLCSLALTYMVLSVPFVFSGICVCLVLTKFSRSVSRLYAADLAGAALGCVVLICVLRITDGPTAVIVVALLASIGAAFFAPEAGSTRLKRIAIAFSVLFACFAIVNAALAHHGFALLRLTWVKGKLEPRPLYEKWNSFSRILVTGNPNELKKPFGWGLSSVYPSEQKVKWLWMTIDAGAGTPIMAFDGNLNDLEHLKYDVTNLVHYIRPNSKVLVVGTGGGRDVLSALVFDQKSVTGVEINGEIINAVNRTFGDFSGHLDQDPRVAFINDEARSYIARQKDKFDIIQVSLIDTWAATAAGAYVLTENSLYTLQGWEVFLEHITDNGVLTFSRWYARDIPAETYRLTTLASASLMRLGIKNPRDHIIIVRRMPDDRSTKRPGIGTILVSKQPFSDEDLDIIEQVSSEMKFELVLSPRFALDSNFATIASGKDLQTFTAQFPMNITAPTDDSPFFFHLLRLRDIFGQQLRKQSIITTPNMRAVFVLGALLVTVVILTFLCIIVPLILTTRRTILKGALPHFLFFASIGFGFMLVEISQMQRLNLFLGHPIYGLAVVLFTLLLSSGLGSFTTQKINNPAMIAPALVRLAALLGVLVLFGKLTPYAASAFAGSTTVVRVFVAMVILFPLGLFMGMPFPLGMKLASAKSALITPWLWGINGSTSVCASVLAVVIAISSSISTSFWTGFACYVIAFITFLWASLQTPRAS